MIFDPHGGYTRLLAQTSTQFVPSHLMSAPIPVNTDLNIAVRAMVNGQYGNYGQVCRYRFLPINNQPMLALENGNGFDFTLFPNPNRTGHVNLSFEGLAGKGEAIVVEIHNAMGQRVSDRQLAADATRFNSTITLGNDFAAGMYLVAVTIDGQRSVKRLIVE